MARRYRKKTELSQRERYLLLQAAAARLGLKVREERLEADDESPRPQGGLVRLKGEWVVFVDKRQPLEVRARLVVEALAGLGGQGAWLPPAVREWVEAGHDQG